ncbi:hypothetical protein VTP01DRAFT_6442 [Rhizomucor pusillus]|uniref:uncharacterized protein n=1 Tax=Rhizomucor pusillus TaxID=4840 RepID=UPI00374246C1
MSQKRQHAGKSESKRKRSKTYHCAKERYAGKSSFSVQPNMSGVMVTCTRGRENRAAKEVLDLFNEYLESLYPDAKLEASGDDENDDQKDDLEASIAKEVAAIKEGKKNKIFANIPMNLDCVIFIRTKAPVEPVQFVHHILTDMKKHQVKKTRYVSRLLPVEMTCQANMDDIERVARQIVTPKFNTSNEDGSITSKAFAIVARVRNCTKIDRSEVIRTIASTIGKDHKVDLGNPELSIIVEICQNICMMSVVKDFVELKKYNLESLLGLNDPKGSKEDSNQ